MDFLSKRVDAVLQDSQRRHVTNSAPGMGQSGSNSQQDMSQVYGNPGATWNMASVTPSFCANANQSLPNQNFNPLFSYGHGYGANAIGFGQTVPNQSSGSQSHGHSANPTSGNPMGFNQTMPNQTSNSFLSQFGVSGSRVSLTNGTNNHSRRPLLPTPHLTGTNSDACQTVANKSLDSHSSASGLGRSRKRRKMPRKVLLPTPTQNFNSPNMSRKDGGKHPDGSLHGGKRSAPSGSRYGMNNPILDASRFGGNHLDNSLWGGDHSAPNSSQYGGSHFAPSSRQYGGNSFEPSSSQYGGNCFAPSSRQYGGNHRILDASQFGGNLPVPDGTNGVKYPAPDVGNLLFDSSIGYRFDPTTGLHYDANSGFYLNYQLKVLLRWDAVTSMYVIVTNDTSRLATPAISLLNKTPSSSSVVAGLSPEGLKALARELAPLLKSKTREPDQYLNHDSSERSDIDHIEYEIQRRRDDRITDLYPSDAKKYRWSCPERSISVEPDLRGRIEPKTWGPYRSPSPSESYERRDYDQYTFTDHTWDDRCDTIPFGGCRSPPAASRSRPKSLRRDRELTIPEINEHNLKDSLNLYGRYFPQYSSPSAYILIAPVPSREQMSNTIVSKHLESVLSSDTAAFRSLRVFQGDSGAPCNYALVRFDNEDAALYWYKLHQGALSLGNPRTQYVTYLFFAEDNWICFKKHPYDKGCDTPTPNFPFRSLCYRCFELRTKLQSPIIKSQLPTKWIGILQLDCITYSSVTDVLKILPPHQGIPIESTEFLREPSGLPIGLCVFQILDKDASSRFFDILKNAGFNVSYVRLDKHALDFPQALSSISMHRGRETMNIQLGSRDTDPKANARLPSGKIPVKERLGTPRSGSIKRKRRKRKPKTICKPCIDPYASIVEKLGGDFVVVDEYTEGENDDEKKEKSEPFLRPKPLRQLIADQLKNAVSLHTKNSGDPDNVFGSLFVDPPGLRAIILLAPIPGGDRDLVKKELEKILTSDSAEFQNVGVFQGKGFGAPCHYGLIQFTKPCDALCWYNKHGGLLHLNDGTNDQFKAFMYFSENNWLCLHCKFTNFPLRTWCNRCFVPRNETDFPVVSESHTPTQFLGISSIGLPINMPESGFTTDNILASLPAEESQRLISCDMTLENKCLPGLCVLKAQDVKDCENLRTHLLSKGWRPLFLQMHDEPSDIAQKKASDIGKTSIISPPEKNVLVDPGSLKHDPLKYILASCKPSQYIILSPAPSISWKVVKEEIMDKLLAADGVIHSCSHHVCRSEYYGSPHDYIQVTFITVEEAISWYDKHSGLLELVLPVRKDSDSRQKELKFTMQLYFSENAWACRNCVAQNFPARSLCHKCYAHRDEHGFTPVTISNTPTRWVGIAGLQRTINNAEQVKKSLPPLDSFTITRMQLVKEENPLLHVGLCVIETPTTSDGQGLAGYIKQRAHKMKVIFVNLNQPVDDSCEQHELGISQIEPSSGVPDFSDNVHIWWQNLNKGITEGEDMLKIFFQDQYLMPFPACDSVFVPFPPKEIVGTVRQFRLFWISLLEKAGVDKEVLENAKLYKGRTVGGPCSYTILKFKTTSDADAWRAKHGGKWVINLENGSNWTSFLHPSISNWSCRKCANPNFPLRIYCFWCYEPRDGGAPLVTIADAPTRFVGVSKFQNWCATEEILFENMQTFLKMKDNQQLKKVHFPTEPSGIPLGLCVLEFENVAVAGKIFAELIAFTQKRHIIFYLEGSSLIHN